MRNHVVSAVAARRPLRQADAALRLICSALALSILVLAARIASVW
ncbi:hypothetical protein [Bradyrhizobium aeschynomenes]|jgi:hypothetical protein|nr:hypothetical protein [Bradyrhizobium aeschynomenes]